MDARCAQVSRWAAILLGVSLPISTAADNILLLVIVVAWLLSGKWSGKWE